MPYCTLTDIKKLIPEERLVQLTDDEGVGVVNEARVDEAIAQADMEINAYLGGRYTVPFSSPVPDIVRKLSMDMAIYHLYSRKLEEIPQTRKDRYDGAIRILKGITEGKISIGEATEPAGESDSAQVSTSEDDRIFTRDKLSGF